MPHYQVRTKKGSIELDTHDLGAATALWRDLPNGSSVMVYDSKRGWTKIDPLAPPAALEPNRALARAKLETIAWEQTPEARRGRSGSRREVLLDTTEGTGIVPLGELTDFQLRRYIGPGRLEEAGDMAKNGREENLSFDLSEYGAAMNQWNAGQGDPIYAVGSYAYSGKIHPDRDTIESACTELERLKRRETSRARKRELGTLIDQTQEILSLQAPNGRRKAKLRSEIDSPEVRSEIEALSSEQEPHTITAHFEHGQWWATCQCGATWSVVDVDQRGEVSLELEQVDSGDEDFHQDDENFDDRYRDNASRRREEPDETAARELSLYIENEYSLIGAPNSQGKAIEKNLLGHLRRGNFDIKKAELAYMYLMEAGAKKYAKEFADGKDWHQIFNKPTRELVAHEFATSFAAEHKGH